MTVVSILIPSWLEEIKVSYSTNKLLSSLLKSVQKISCQLISPLKKGCYFIRTVFISMLILVVLKDFHDGTHEGLLKL